MKRVCTQHLRGLRLDAGIPSAPPAFLPSPCTLISPTWSTTAPGRTAWSGSTKLPPRPISRCSAYSAISSATAFRFHCNLNLSPILLEQLAHPVFLAEFPHYLGRKIVAAQEDEAFFIQSGEAHYAETRPLLAPLLLRGPRRLQPPRRQHHRRFPPLQRHRPDQHHHLRRHPRLHAPARHRRKRPRADPHRRRRPTAATSARTPAASGRPSAAIAPPASGTTRSATPTALPRRPASIASASSRRSPSPDSSSSSSIPISSKRADRVSSPYSHSAAVNSPTSTDLEPA